jgi:Fe-S-cluster containining protein
VPVSGDDEPRRALRQRMGMDPGEAAAMTTALYAQLDVAAETRAEELAQAGTPLACHRGCIGCCHSVVAASEPEVVTIVRWLGRDDNADARAGFLTAYPRWRAALGADHDAVADALDRSSRRATLDALGAAFRRAVLCAFNRDGECMIYPVRPVVCRSAHAIDGHARCAPDATEPAHLATDATFDAVLGSVMSMLGMVHGVMTSGRRRVPLCDAVHDQLAALEGEPPP